MKEMMKKETDSGTTWIGVLDRVENEYSLCILGYLNEWIEDRTRVGITVAFGSSRR